MDMTLMLLAIWIMYYLNCLMKIVILFKSLILMAESGKEKTITIDGFIQKEIGNDGDEVLETEKPELTSEAPVLHKNKYSVKVRCNVETTRFELIGLNDENIVATTIDGNFTNINPAPQGSYNSYRVRAILKDGSITAPKQISGFDAIEETRPEQVPAPSVAEIQRELLTENTILGNNPKIIQNVRLHFTNIQSGETAPSLIADIQNKIDMGIWDHVTVNRVSANTNGKVTDIYMTISY